MMGDRKQPIPCPSSTIKPFPPPAPPLPRYRSKPDIGNMRCEECGIVHERMISIAEVTVCRACLEKAINALDGFTRRYKPYIDDMPPIICKKHGREDCEECQKNESKLEKLSD